VNNKVYIIYRLESKRIIRVLKVRPEKRLQKITNGSWLLTPALARITLHWQDTCITWLWVST